MKKLLLWAMLAFPAALSVSAMESVEPVLISEEITTEECHILDEKQTAFIERIILVLEEKGAMLDGLVGDNELVSMEATELRQRLIENYELTLDASYYNECFMIYSSSKEIIDALKEYVADLKKLIAKAKNMTDDKMTSYKEANMAFATLQNHMFDVVAPFASLASKSAHRDEFTISLQVSEDDNNIDAEVQLNQDVSLDLDAEKLQSIFSLDGRVDGRVDGEAISANGSIAMDVRAIGNNLYVGLNQLSFFAQNAPEDIREIQEAIRVLQSVRARNYIKVPVDEGDATMALDFDPAMLFEAQQVILEATDENIPMITFIHNEGNTYYGVLNKDFCRLIDDSFARRDCLETADDMLTISHNKGVFFLTIETDRSRNNTYTFGMTPMFSEDGEEMKEEIGFVLDIPLFTWNDKEIVTITIPFDQSNTYGFWYGNHEIEVHFADEEASFSLEGMINDKQFKVDAAYESFFDGTVAQFGLDATETSPLSDRINVYLDVQEAFGPHILLEIDGNRYQRTYSTPLIPTPILDADVFQERLDKAMQAAGL